MSHSRLIHFVSDLMQDGQLRKEFNENPRMVTRRYDLGEDATACLFTMSPQKISDWIADEIAGYSFDPSEFPRLSFEWLPDVGVGIPAYPSPEPAVFRISPRCIPIKGPEETFEFIVYGQSFAPEVSVQIRDRARDSGGALHEAPPLPPQATPFGTFRCSGLRVLAAGVVPPSQLYVTVVNYPGTAHATPIPAPYPLDIVDA